jgi:hypothetical protein
MIADLKTGAEVVGSNPTRSIFVNLVEYVIDSRLFQIVVGQNIYDKVKLAAGL